MRRLLVGVVLSACGTENYDPQDPCADGVDSTMTCPVHFDPQPIVSSWVFEKRDGSEASTCLPDSPSVTVTFDGVTNTVRCSDGQVVITPTRSPPAGRYQWSISSQTDQVWTVTGLSSGPRDPPHAVFYTDVGGVHASWSIHVASSASVWCADSGIYAIRFSADAEPVDTLPCQYLDGEGGLGNVPVGQHMMMAQALGSHDQVIEASDPVPVTIVASATVDASFDLRVP